MYIQQKLSNGTIKSIPFDLEARKYFNIHYVNEAEDKQLSLVTNSKSSQIANSFCTDKTFPERLSS